MHKVISAFGYVIHGWHTLYFFSRIYIYCIDKLPKRVYNKIIERRTKQISVKHWKGETAGMGKKKQKKKPIKWQSLAANALIDLIVGAALIIIDKLLG